MPVVPKSVKSDASNKSKLKKSERNSMRVCELCGKDAGRNLASHMIMHTKEKRFKCEICYKFFSTKYNLRNHVLRLHEIGEKPLVPCPICYNLYREITLKSHLRIHTSEKNFKCKKCPQRFRTKAELDFHIVTHLSPNEKVFYPCEICCSKFTRKGSLRDHVKLKHSGIFSRYICTFCDLNCRSQTALAIHMRTHTRETPFSCTLCDRAFKSKGTLNLHIRHLHFGERKFQCHLCDKNYAFKCRLTRHLLIHEGKPKYPCTICDTILTTPKGIQNHMIAHSGVKSFQCNVCDKRFAFKGGLKTHSQVHSKQLLQCTKCSSTFMSKSALYLHTIKHRNRKYTCVLCKKEYAYPQSLSAHVKAVHTANEK